MIRPLLLTVVVAGVSYGQSRPVVESRPAAESSETRSGAAAFEPLFKFCPAHIESLMCISIDLLPSRGSLASLGAWQDDDDLKIEKLPRCRRSLATGSKFSWRGVSIGDYEGIDVSEFEANAPPLRDVLDLKKFSLETIDGFECYLREPYKRGDREEGPVENWITLVDGRFLIQATRRSILREALTRRGPPSDACIAQLGWDAKKINWSSPIVIVRKYDQTNDRDGYSPTNAKAKNVVPLTRGFHIDGVAFTYDDANTGKARLEVSTKDPEKALDYFRELFGDRGLREKSHASVEPAGFEGIRRTMSVTFRDDSEGAELLSIFVLFGYNIFI